MKKFFPLCLLLIVALVWTVSIAGDEGFISKSHQPGEAQKAPAIEKDRAVAKTGEVAPVSREVNAAERERAIARAKTSRVSGEPIPASITPTHEEVTVPKTRAEGAVPAEETLIDDRTRMKDIKADGVISPDERALYEELLSMAPVVELPVPLAIVSETEPNNTCQTANLIACSDTVWCADLTFGQDNNDWYTFTLTDAQQVRIETHSTGTACPVAEILDTWLELWTGDCLTMLAFDDDGGADLYSLIVMNLAAGTYAINSDATHWGGQTGSYHLSLLCTPIVPVWYCLEDPPFFTLPTGKLGGGFGDIEPNDICADASMAQCEYAYCGAISVGTDIDWYYVDIPADTSYSLHIRVFADDTPNQYAYGGGLDSRVELWGPGCTTMIDMNDDYYGTFPDAVNWDSQIDPTGFPNCFPPGVRVYIKVWSYYGDPGPYLLIINCEPCEIPSAIWSCVDDPPLYVPPDNKLPGGNIDTEPNDSCTYAEAAFCEYAYCGDISTLTDMDWFYVDLPSDTTYSLHIRVFANDTPNQYAQGGGLDPWVGLYKSDCVTLVTFNEDYNGTFPDAEGYDSQIDPDPLTGNCFDPGERVYIQIDEYWDTVGPYLLIINCVPCEKPTGACCVDDICVATNTEDECALLQGEWWIGEDCSAFVRCAPIGNCDSAFYNNGAPVDQYGSPASQCIYDFDMGVGAVDDIMLTQDEYVTRIITWTAHWNGNIGGPARYDGINVTFYLDDIQAPGQPGGYPEGDCSHVMTSPGGIYSTQFVPMGMVNWQQDNSMTCTTDRWMLEIYLPAMVQLFANTLYWLEIQPIMAFGTGGQSAILLSDLNTGANAMQWFDAPPWASIDGNSADCPPNQAGLYKDLAFCLIAPPPPIWSCVDDPPTYIPPDNKRPGGNIDTEPNDVCIDAEAAFCEYAYCGDISTTADMDWFYIDLPADTTYSLHIRVFANDTPNQYAYGGGLDSWVGLYKSDCVTLVTFNEDYNGTFPDAEGFDSQIDPDPLTGNCFDPGERVYIQIDEYWGTVGPYLLIINCVPCEKPTGACCVDDICVATNTEDECALLQGEWWIGEDCSAFVRCGPIGNCDDAFYNNGGPVDQYGSPASQCIYDFDMGVGAVDDIVLTQNKTVTRIITWTAHWNGNIGGPARYDGINVTFYLDDVQTPGQPGGYPEGDCSHVMTSPGGIYSTQFVPMGMVNWEEDNSMTCTTDRWMLEIYLPIEVPLSAATLYWLEVQPIMAFGAGGQSAIMLSDLNTGANAMQWFDAPPWASIDGNSAACPPNQAGLYKDLAFCLIGPVGGCDYVVGDVNGSDDYNGLDITFGVAFFKGGIDPICDTCDCPPHTFFWVCGDVNGSCSYNGLDITYGVAYLKGGPALIPCPDCPPIGPAGDNSQPERPSVIKTKTIFQQKPISK